MKQLSSLGLRGEVDFLRRNNNKDLIRQKKIRTIKLKSFHVIFICLLLIFMGFLIFRSAQFILTWDKLKIKTVKLINTPRFGKAKVKNILQYFNGNILSLDFDYIRSELMNLNDVKDVSLSRTLPSTVEIYFRLREPIFQLFLKKQYQVIDEAGVILYKSNEKRSDLMTIKGVKIEDLEYITACLPELRRIKHSLDYISFRKPFGVMVKLKKMREIFYPGEKNYLYKINYFLKLREKLALNKYKINSVDLRFPNRFYLEFDEGVNN